MASTDQLQRLLQVVSQTHRRKGVMLILWGDGSGSIRVTDANHSYGVYAAHTNKVCEWNGDDMGVQLWAYAKKLVDELHSHDPSGDPLEDMLQILEE